MPKVLIFPYSNQLGSTIPTLTLASLLEKEGYDIEFAASGKYINVIKEKGYKLHKISEISYKQYRSHVDNNNVDFYCNHLVRHIVDEEVNLINKIKPDLLVHNNRPTLKISSQVTKKKLVSIVIPTLVRYYDYRFFIPDNHFLNQLIPFVDVNRILPSKVVKMVYDITVRKWVRGMNEVLRYFNLKEIKDYLEACEGDITLINQTYGLGKFKNLPENYYFLEQDLDSTFGQKYSWIKDVKKAKKENKKIIYVSMGSSAFEAYPLVIKNLANFVLEHQDEYVLISNHCGLESDYKDKKNIYIEKFIDIKSIMEYIDIVVTHGGINTLNECVINYKPVVGVPEQGEQLWNLKYIEYLGLGKAVTQLQLRNDNNLLKDTINDILHDKSYLQSLKRFVSKNLKKKDLEDHKKNIVKAINSIVN